MEGLANRQELQWERSRKAWGSVAWRGTMVNTPHHALKAGREKGL